MEIRITKSEEDVILKGDMLYVEGKSRQEGKPSFFISTDDFEVDFVAKDASEFDKFIMEAQEPRAEFSEFSQGN